jgi:hypothetical protein
MDLAGDGSRFYRSSSFALDVQHFGNTARKSCQRLHRNVTLPSTRHDWSEDRPRLLLLKASAMGMLTLFESRQCNEHSLAPGCDTLRQPSPAQVSEGH